MPAGSSPAPITMRSSTLPLCSGLNFTSSLPECASSDLYISLPSTAILTAEARSSLIVSSNSPVESGFCERGMFIAARSSFQPDLKPGFTFHGSNAIGSSEFMSLSENSVKMSGSVV